MLKSLFALLSALSLSLFFLLPEDWRDSAWKIALWVVFHVVGFIVLEGQCFFMYRVPDGLFKDFFVFLTSFYIVAFPFIVFWALIKGIVRGICTLTGNTGGILNRYVSNKPVYLITIFVVIGVVFIAGYVRTFFIEKTEYTVSSVKTGESGDIKIAAVSDIHLGSGTNPDQLRKITDMIKKEDPDVLFNIGDLADETTTENMLRLFSEEMSRLQPKYGKYFVTGNHDGNCHYDYKEALAAGGVTILSNELIKVGDVSVIGLDDGSENGREVTEGLLQENGISPESPMIVLKHRPEKLDRFGGTGADLILCGHTHGAKYGIDRPFMSLINDPVYGKKEIGDMTAITTSGAGAWGYRCKPAVPNEIIMVSFKMSTSPALMYQY